MVMLVMVVQLMSVSAGGYALWILGAGLVWKVGGVQGSTMKWVGGNSRQWMVVGR